MMHIEHVALWTRDLEQLKSFYETYFGAQASAKYTNAEKQFESCFLTLGLGARLELMQMPTLLPPGKGPTTGYAHLALSAGSEAQVDTLTARLRKDGHQVVSGPRRTGDGYYESVVCDPDGNRIEITV
jgi:lactoylglutathione lyase